MEGAASWAAKRATLGLRGPVLSKYSLRSNRTMVKSVIGTHYTSLSAMVTRGARWEPGKECPKSDVVPAGRLLTFGHHHEACRQTHRKGPFGECWLATTTLALTFEQGYVTVRPEEDEDMWHLYNLIQEVRSLVHCPILSTSICF